MAEKRPTPVKPLTIYFYHTRLTRESYEEWKDYKFPGHILYGLPLLEKYGIRSVMHKYKAFPSRLKLMFYATKEILCCKEPYEVLYGTSFRGLELIILLRALGLYRKPIVIWHHTALKTSSRKIRERISRFFYKGIEELSDNYWKAAYATLSEGEKYLNQLEDSESDKNLSDTIKLESALIQAQLYGYYSTYIDGEKVCTINDLIMTCETLTDLLPGTMRDAARLLSAKALLYNKEYAGAITYSEAILNEGNYTLEGNEIIWKGYMDASGNNVDPLLLQEAYIISAIAYYNTGNQDKALELLNAIAGPVSNIENIDTTVYLNLLKGTGEIYPYYRLLTSMNISVSYPLDFGFDVSRNLLFPVPKEAMDEYPELIQNPGY